MNPEKRASASTRGRIAITVIVVLMAGIGAALTMATSRRSLGRLALVEERSQEIGIFSGARLRLQRRTFEILPRQLAGNNLLVDDIRIQLAQARDLGTRLPDDVLATIDHLSNVLSLPLVSRSDLVSAALLLEGIVVAEAEARERLFRDSVADLRRERTFILLGLLTTTSLLLFLVWVAPGRAAAPSGRSSDSGFVELWSSVEPACGSSVWPSPARPPQAWRTNSVIPWPALFSGCRTWSVTPRICRRGYGRSWRSWSG